MDALSKEAKMQHRGQAVEKRICSACARDDYCTAVLQVMFGFVALGRNALRAATGPGKLFQKAPWKNCGEGSEKNRTKILGAPARH